MAIDKTVALTQIDSAIAQRAKMGQTPWNHTSYGQMIATYASIITRLTHPGSSYRNNLDDVLNTKIILSQRDQYCEQKIFGIIQALRNDYQQGFMQSLTELIHADMFSDFLEMAEHLLQQGYKDPAAVMAGAVLEEHLRKLCAKHGVTLPAHGKLNSMNDELVKVKAYDKNEKQQVTAWAGLRNDAAHGNYGNYDKTQVENMVIGIRGFLSRRPA